MEAVASEEGGMVLESRTKDFHRSANVLTSARYDLCWHEVLVVVGLSFNTFQPGIQLLV